MRRCPSGGTGGWWGEARRASRCRVWRPLASTARSASRCAAAGDAPSVRRRRLARPPSPPPSAPPRPAAAPRVPASSGHALKARGAHRLTFSRAQRQMLYALSQLRANQAVARKRLAKAATAGSNSARRLAAVGGGWCGAARGVTRWRKRLPSPAAGRLRFHWRGLARGRATGRSRGQRRPSSSGRRRSQ